MRGRPGRGALVGLATGALLVVVLILLPRALQGSFYEITDPLVVMGIPLLVIGTAVGCLVGAPGRRPDELRPRTQAPVARPRSIALPTLAVGTGVLALWLLLWGVGAVDVAPLGIG